MNALPTLSLPALTCCVLLMSTIAAAQSPTRWLAHDMRRPRPSVVTPGKQALPAPAPSDAVILFDGKDLSNWRDAMGGPAKWKAQDGYMESVPLSGYVYTAGKFGDVQLHVEWAAPLPAVGSSQGRGNSGIFLMGLYEVQVLDSYNNDTYPDGQAGAVYGQYPPLVNASLPPGEWQSYDIVFRRPRFDADGRVTKPARLTVIHNGVLVQDSVEVWGPTAWLQNLPYSPGAEKLPIGLQDHGNPVRYRNMWLRELNEAPDPTPPENPERQIVELSPERLRQFVGTYSVPWGELGRIELDGTQLRLHMKTGQVIDLLPLSDSGFAMRYTAGSVDFVEKDPGKITGFSLLIGGQRVPVSRAKSEK
jgi:hypothetical protein